jgi:DNA-binding transcriptional ArsR family regulator
MIKVELDPGSVARVRVAASPIFEVVTWLAVAASGTRHPIFGDPGASARFALRDRDVAATAAMISAGPRCCYLPDFLIPAPRRSQQRGSLDEQLQVVRATQPAEAAAQLPADWWSRLFEAGSPPVATAEIPVLAARGLEAFWRIALADEWANVQHAVANDVHRCGQLLAAGGVGRLFNSLRPAARWQSDHLLLMNATEATTRFVDEELVLVPSFLTPHRLTVQLDDHRNAFVAFPVRARRSRHETVPHASAPFGRGRTAVLSALATPGSTRELSQFLRITESTVSHHLRALVQADLAQAHRDGRRVIYSLTPLGKEMSDRVAIAAPG